MRNMATINAAIGIYKQLMEHGDARLRGLQRNVGYFYIVALSKRKQYALAADEAARWLTTYNRRDERRSPEGLGVLIELAKNIDAQMDQFRRPTDPRRSASIVDAVSQVVRFASPFKKDAMALLKKYKPSAAVRAEEIARLSYEDLMGKADEAIGSHEWDARDHSAHGGHPQGRPRQEPRQGQHGALQSRRFVIT